MGPWELAWFVGVYAALLICLFACVRIGFSIGWWHALFNVLALVAFAVCHWLLESWANTVAPFYSYPQDIFPDMVRHFDFDAWGFGPGDDCCTQPPSPKVSATIPVSGAVITFALMWTARLLLTTNFWKQPYRPVIVPLMAALAALTLDLFMDPVLAISNSCPCLGPAAQIHPGMGYWDWFTRASFADWWFDIPLFNFANWYAFPATMAAVAVLLGWLQNAVTSSNPNLTEGLLYLLLAMSFALILVTAPDAEPPLQQLYFIIVVIAISLYLIYRDWGTYKRNNPFRWEFVVPVAFYSLYTIAALLFSGAFSLSSAWLLILITLVGAALLTWFTTRPYFP